MKIVAAVIILILAIPACIFFYRNALDRSKSNKTSLFGSFNGEYREDNLGKITPAALEGLEEAGRKKKLKEQTKDHPQNKNAICQKDTGICAPSVLQ